MGDIDPEGTSRALTAIERNAEAQRRLIEDLLDLSRVVSGRLQLARSIVPLANVIEAALDAVRPRAAEKGVRIETVIVDSDVQVLADGQRMQQVVWNLAWNAVKFTPAGGWVSVQLRRSDGVAELTVVDSGIGIAPEFLPHVFDWYRQADGASGAVESGLGLGLGLVRQLVELHNGTVAAHSAGAGHGATFIVRLPLYRRASDTGGASHSIAS
jgi:signal transduction histidine kinase